jgi:hypothetical protein
MSSSSDFRDHDAEKIGERQWDLIRTEWRTYVPQHESPWPVPEHEVNELPTLDECLREMGHQNKRDFIFEGEIGALRSATLHESVILIHKAGNVLRAAAEEGGHGFRTWSRSSAYHAAFFAMRGVLGLLGVLTFRAKDSKSDYQLDLWAPREKKRRLGVTESQFAVRIIRRGRGLEHKELWGMFSRVLRITKIDIEVWPLIKQDPLRHLDPSDFSHVRHQIHYRSTGWLFKDLDSLTETDDFTKLAEHVVAMKHLQAPLGHDFPACLALHILSLGMALLMNLGKDIPKIKDEVKRAQKWMNASPWKHANAFGLVGASSTN